MYLYKSSVREFINKCESGQIANILKTDASEQLDIMTDDNEYNSWAKSLPFLASQLNDLGLDENDIILEYQLPFSSRRIDCILCGNNADLEPSILLIELKQWSSVQATDCETNVMTWLDGGMQESLHPVEQVRGYQCYLQDSLPILHVVEGSFRIYSCALLHNYEVRKDADPIFNSQEYRQFVFCKSNLTSFRDFVLRAIGNRTDPTIAQSFLEAEYQPSKKLLKNVSTIIKGHERYQLLDDQMAAYQRILKEITHSKKDGKKKLIYISGSPGAGKSVISLNLLADLCQRGLKAHYSTGSFAFTGTLREILKDAGSSSSICTYFNSYSDGRQKVDVIICDEGHRIREKSNNHSSKYQIQELVEAADVLVFFIDKNQRVRPNEVGSLEWVEHAAKAYNADLFKFDLSTQFRCAGSLSFINFVDHNLGIRRTKNEYWSGDRNFELKFFDSPTGLERAILQKVESGHDARMVAGFCWPWAKTTEDGKLVRDVRIPEYGFARPWNPNHNLKKLGNYPEEAPPSHLWAYHPKGMGQVGCIYTAQGFEFDYVGVIIGPDLYFDPQTNRWKANPEKSHDWALTKEVQKNPEKMLEFVKNSYRVLMTRGMKGCYVFCVDPHARDFLKSRLQI